MELIRQELETYALLFPNVSFSLESLQNDASSSKGRVFRIPKVCAIIRICKLFDLQGCDQSLSSLTAFRNIYGKALVEVRLFGSAQGFALFMNVQHVEEIEHSSEGLKLSGFISLDGSPSKVISLYSSSSPSYLLCLKGLPIFMRV